LSSHARHFESTPLFQGIVQPLDVQVSP
jgi:hypothetical protein